MVDVKFTRFAWVVLAYSVLVILFGSFVRASLSGDGCGMHWPQCGGTLFPDGSQPKQIVEWTHRATSGLYGLFVLALGIWSLRVFPKGSPVRKATFGVGLFTLTEVLVGALLVKKGWVTTDTSVARIVVMGFHLVNTFFLLACNVLAIHFASGGRSLRLRGQGQVGWAVSIGAIALLCLGVTGAITALGDTIFPSASFIEGVRQDLDPTSHFSVRLRFIHPLIATSVGLYLLFAVGLVLRFRHSQPVRKYGQWLVGAFIAQIAFGVLNLLINAPIWAQVVHLAVSDLIWILLIMFGANALSIPVTEPGDEPTPTANLAAGESGPGFVAMVREYALLTKPRVISLLLFTTLAAMFVAARGWPGGWLLVAVAIGGYMAAGAAHVFNNVIDRDIDGSMERTAGRALVQHTISTTQALVFGFSLAFGSFILLWASANLLSAAMAMTGLLFYVFVYTLALKRRTSQNIVIGGAAGAFPPLVGYAAVTGYLDPIAWYLFWIIFLWTPVHFWALALMIKDDYAKAGIPMLPVVKGERVTVLQIGVYTALTAVVSIVPLLQGQVGAVYLVGAGLLNIGLIAQSLQLFRYADRPRARSLFKYSMVYLALLFLTIAFDRAGWLQ